MTKQTINIGSSANDGTGTPIRDAFDMVNDNFTEIYARMTPVWGTLFPEVIAAVKYLQISEINGGGFLFISNIIAGTGSAPNLTYTIEVSKTTTLASAGDVVMKYTNAAVAVAKTGLEVMALAENDGSGVTGYMIINWSNLTLGATYQMPYLQDGGVFAFTVSSARYAVNDSLIDYRTEDGAALDGTKQLYVFNAPAAILNTTLSAVASVKGAINIKNISTFEVKITGAAAETFDAKAGPIQLAANSSMTITPYDGNFIISQGVYTASV